MMRRKMGFAEMSSAILTALRERTPYPIYDAIPPDAPTPFIYVELTGKTDSSTKTMYKETFTASIHLLAKANPSRLEIYRMIQAVEEAMTKRVCVPPGITLVMQWETGVNSLKQDETGEWHGVLNYEFTVSYGFRTKTEMR